MNATESSQAVTEIATSNEEAASTTGQQAELIYPSQFLGFLTERLFNTLSFILSVYRVPDPAIKALDNLQFINILMYVDPEKFEPGGRKAYDADLRVTVEEIINQVAELDDLSRNMVHEKYDELSQSGLGALQQKSGWSE